MQLLSLGEWCHETVFLPIFSPKHEVVKAFSVGVSPQRRAYALPSHEVATEKHAQGLTSLPPLRGYRIFRGH